MTVRGLKLISCFLVCLVVAVAIIFYMEGYLQREDRRSQETKLKDLLEQQLKPTPIQYTRAEHITRNNAKKTSYRALENITSKTTTDHHPKLIQTSTFKNVINKENDDFTMFKQNSEKLFENITREKNGVKLVLLWNPLYKSMSQVKSFLNMACPSSNCDVTDDKAKLQKSDAVFFEAENIMKMPKKKAEQVWIYSNMEAPAYQPSGIKSWDNLFNWTMTYRRDSDIEMLYGAIKPLGAETKNVLTRVHHYKQKDMIWFVSKCKTPGLRHVDAAIINKTVHIDVIGNCGKNICPKSESHCYDKLRNETYKFYFAAENSHCRDYISEKAINSLNVYSIPVVRGGANYSLHLPPHSYIDDRNFSSPEDLANFVKYVGDNSGLYDSYFQYKKYYYISRIHFENVNMFCEMCYRLNHQDKYRRLYKSIKSWWYGNGQDDDFMCRKSELPDLPA